MISSVFIHLKKRSDASDSLFTVGSDGRYPLLLVLLVFFGLSCMWLIDNLGE